ncbi:serine hydrolase [Flavobacterium silvaticum]|uniref:Serine hydrolase n=1 Tax=Flavobacterium silvaticum TaxID=1852020 RepID=A0A972FSR4_9FLAO|nr:serine hydrolase [Flavobacterium silvaticum]NMH26855.1 serine hydrolase [Flavobacterium silvaticum]
MKKNYFLAVLILSIFGHSQTGIYVPGMSACDTQMTNFLTTYNIPSATFAITKNGKLVFSRAYGHSDIGQTDDTQPYNMFRIASISKPLTSIGIMKMIENGQLALDDKVFGPGGLLENHWYFSTATIVDNRVYDITVRMLLEHNAGWDRDIDCFPNPTTPYPWDFGGCDPISVPLHVTATLGETNPVKEEYLIAYLLGKPLNHDPGTTYSYSNMGFLVLSEIIEEISGMDYEAWMQQEILEPLGIYDMHIGKNLLSEKMEREGEYVGNGYSTYSLYNDNTLVPWEYGGFSVEAMDGHGGWIATARDLLRLMVAADGFATKPDILSASSIATMVEPSATNSWYAKGWSVNTANNWWHSGALDGTASYLVRSNSGYTWAIILNKRAVGSLENAFWNGLDALGWNCLAAVTEYPTYDLFESPLLPAQNLNAGNIGGTSMGISWTNGNGTDRVVVMKPIPNNTAPLFESYPIDGTDYNNIPNFAAADALPDGSRIVYKGTGTTVDVSGLIPNQMYAIRVYELTKNEANGNHALYLLGEPPQLVVTTTTLSASENLVASISVYPNPASSEIRLLNPNGLALTDASLSDANGRVVKKLSLSNQLEYKIPVNQLPSGVYFLTVNSSAGKTVRKIVRE